MLKKLLIFSLCLISIKSFAMDGKELYQYGLVYHQNKKTDNISFYNEETFAGYILGVADSVLNFCPSKKSTNKQMLDVVFDYLQKHPKDLNQRASILVNKAITEKWPCN